MNDALDAIALSPEFSEDRLALNFTDRFEKALRYVATLGKWFIWDGTRWKIDDTQLARDRVRAVCREYSSRCNASKQAKLIASAKTISAVERLASTDRRVAATIGQFDGDPWLLNTPGGTIDLHTGKLREHHHENRWGRARCRNADAGVESISRPDHRRQRGFDPVSAPDGRVFPDRINPGTCTVFPLWHWRQRQKHLPERNNGGSGRLSLHNTNRDIHGLKP